MKTQTDRTLHEILREMPCALYAIGLRGGHAEVNFLIVSWLTQCSFDPPLLMMAVRRNSFSYDLISEGDAFSVNLIDKGKRELAQQLVKPADRVGDKVGKFDYSDGETGAPILRDAFAYIECKVREIHEPGDHAIVIGEIVNGGQRGTGDQLACSDLHWHYAG
jgi:flavin reductase (DIM6/NTAB) family NADH-FMN oxidoreductase RutF